jgi:probable rRNA maturation factor
MKAGVANVIRVRNLQRTVPVRLSDLRTFAARALARCLPLRSSRQGRLQSLPEISVLLVSERRMAAVHRQFLGQDGPTDVITFDHGEIVISVPTARRQATEFSTSLSHELRLYLVHGLLHLQGFDDRTRSEARQMAKLQERIVAEA